MRLALAVLAAHGALIAALLHSVKAPGHAPAVKSIAVRLVPLPSMKAPADRAPTATEPRAVAASRAVANERRAARSIVSPRTAASKIDSDSTAASTVIADQARAASAPASAPEPEPGTAPDSLLNTAATRRAIQGAARAPGLGSRVDAQVGVHEATAAQQLPENIKQAGKGDCMKGEYLGGGMGLLSAPFLVGAMVAGNCAK